MKYVGMPFGMWTLFAPSFRKQLTAVFGYDADTAKAISKKAKPKYKTIIRDLPEFEKGDRFKMNLVNCAMIGAFILSMPKRPDVERLTVYYANAMMTKPMKWFCRRSGKSKFTEKDIAGMKAAAALRAADRNPYSWNMEFYEYPDGSGYELMSTMCDPPFQCQLHQLLGRWTHILISLSKRNNGKSHALKVLYHLYRSPSVKGDFLNMKFRTKFINELLNESIMNDISFRSL